MVVPLVTKAVIDGPVAHGDQAALWALGLLATGLGVLEALLTFIRRWIVAVGAGAPRPASGWTCTRSCSGCRWPSTDRWQSGQLLWRMMSDLSTTRRFLGFGLLFIIMNVVQILVVTALLLHMYWPLGLVVVASIVPITWACLHNEREYTRLSRIVQDQTGDVASAVEEGAHGLRVIKAFGRARWIFDKFDARSMKLYETSMARVQLSARFWTFLEIIPSVTLIIVLGFGAVAAGQGKVTLGTLVAFITLMLSLVWPVAALGFLLAMAQEAMTGGRPDRGDLRRRERHHRR